MASLLKALQMATIAHIGHVRLNSNEPYVLHGLAIARSLEQHGESEELQISALLSDVLALGTVQPEAIDNSFGRNVLRNVQALTEPDFFPDQEEVSMLENAVELSRYYASKSYGVKTVKLADMAETLVFLHIRGAGVTQEHMDSYRIVLEGLTKGNKTIYGNILKYLDNFKPTEGKENGEDNSNGQTKGQEGEIIIEVESSSST